MPTASAPEDSSSALRNAASPPNSASPRRRGPARGRRRASAAVSRPNSVDGTSSVISAYPIRPSAETRSVANGSLTVATCSIVRDLGQRRGDGRPEAVQLLALGGGEHGDRGAARRLGEALLEQLDRLGALAAGCAEVVGEGAAESAGEHHDEGGEDRPRADRRPWPACADVADAADEAVHGVLPVVVWWVIGAGWAARAVDRDLGDRDQRQAQVADLLEQAVQRGLVDDRAVEDGGAVALVGEGQPVEPRGPPRSRWPASRISYCPASCDELCPSDAWWLLVHAPEGRSGCGERGSPHVVIEVVISPTDGRLRLADSPT